MIRIHFAYKHVDGAWGGANNFIRALHAHLAASGRFALTDAIDSQCDILFMNQLGMGPGADSRLWSIRNIERIVRGHRALRTAAGRQTKLVVRAVNLNSHAFRMGIRNRLFGARQDAAAIRLLNMADTVIFQSDYQRAFFREAGFNGLTDVTIHNGADRRFWVDKPPHPPVDAVLRLVSSTASPRESKRHDLIAKVSSIPGVEVRHLGAWPEKVDARNVQLLGGGTPESMVDVLSSAHYLLHPAIKDPCPNVVFEAVCAGLPVIYSPGPGSSREIVDDCGLPLDEARPEVTVESARKALADLRSVVLRRRAGFRIDHAAARYQDVFEQLAH